MLEYGNNNTEDSVRLKDYYRIPKSRKVIALKAKKGCPDTAEVIMGDGCIYKGEKWYDLIKDSFTGLVKGGLFSNRYELATHLLNTKHKHLLYICMKPILNEPALNDYYNEYKEKKQLTANNN